MTNSEHSATPMVLNAYVEDRPTVQYGDWSTVDHFLFTERFSSI